MKQVQENAPQVVPPVPSPEVSDDWVAPPITLPLSVTAGLGPMDEICFHEIRNAGGVIIASTWGGPDPELAALIVRAVNCHHDMLALIKDLQARGLTTTEDHERVTSILERAGG